jgi:hypothetical protein
MLVIHVGANGAFMQSSIVVYQQLLVLEFCGTAAAVVLMMLQIDALCKHRIYSYTSISFDTVPLVLSALLTAHSHCLLLYAGSIS